MCKMYLLIVINYFKYILNYFNIFNDSSYQQFNSKIYLFDKDIESNFVKENIKYFNKILIFNLEDSRKYEESNKLPNPILYPPLTPLFFFVERSSNK